MREYDDGTAIDHSDRVRTSDRETAVTMARLNELQILQDHVIVCLSGLSVHTNGAPIFGCKVYGPFTAAQAEDKKHDIARLEGGAVLVRPLVDLADTYRRLSAD